MVAKTVYFGVCNYVMWRRNAVYTLSDTKILMHRSMQICIYWVYFLKIDVAANADANIKEISSLNCWELILAGIRRHSSVPKLVVNGCLALAAIVEADGKIFTVSFVLNFVYTPWVKKQDTELLSMMSSPKYWPIFKIL